MLGRGKFVSVLISAVLFSLCLISKARADSPKIYFNEIMWQGSSASADDEWVELYNDSERDLDLSKSPLTLFDEVKNIEIARLDSDIFPAKSFFLVAYYQSKNANSILAFDWDNQVRIIKAKRYILNNERFKISLKDNSGNVLDIAGDGNAPFYPQKPSQKSSMQRINFDSYGDHGDAWALSMERKHLVQGVLDYATPGDYGKTLTSLSLEKNKFRLGDKISLFFDYKAFDPQGEFKKVYVKLQKAGEILAESSGDFGQQDFSFDGMQTCPEEAEIAFYDKNDDKKEWAKEVFELVCYQLSQNVKFSEVLPHPKNKDWNEDGKISADDEWIELVNLSETLANLNGWKIQDASGRVFEIKNKLIPAGGFIVFYHLESGLALNDDGEKLFLFDPEGNQVDFLEIVNSTSHEDQAWAKDCSSWAWTIFPTPGAQNQIVIKQESPLTPTPIPSESNSQAPAPASAPAPAPATISEVPQEEFTVIETKTIITKTTRIVPAGFYSLQNIPPLTLADSTQTSPPPSKFNQFLLYFIGLIIIFVQVLSYELYRQE